MSTLTIWIGVPLFGGLIGYLASSIALRVIFRPIRPVRILGLDFQGALARRQRELAGSVGRLVGDHLVQRDDIRRCFERVDLEGLLGDVLEQGLAPKIEELRRFPLVGRILTEERAADLRQAALRALLRRRELMFDGLERAVEQGLNVREMIAEKVATFPVARLQELVREVAARELRTIEILGGVLGLLIGLAQAALIAVLA